MIPFESASHMYIDAFADSYRCHRQQCLRWEQEVPPLIIIHLPWPSENYARLAQISYSRHLSDLDRTMWIASHDCMVCAKR